MDELARVLAQGVPVTLTLLATLQALTRRLAGIGALARTGRFPNPGVPRLWGVAWGSILLVILVTGLGAARAASPSVLLVLGVLGAVPFGFARLNAYLLMRRTRGRIAPGTDWTAARRGEAFGFATLGLFAAAHLWPVARHLEAAVTVGVIGGVALIAVWRPPAGHAKRPGARTLMSTAVAVIVGSAWVAWPIGLSSALGSALAGAAAATVAGYLLVPRCVPLRRALEAGTRRIERQIADAAAALLAIALVGGAATWSVATLGTTKMLRVGLAVLLVAAVVDVVVHRIRRPRKGARP